jgi:hypothetical protein
MRAAIRNGVIVLGLALLGVGLRSHGQAQPATTQPPGQQIAAVDDLPDSPGALLEERIAATSPPSLDPPQDPTKTAADSAGYIKWAPKYHRTVHPDERAYTLTATDKLKLSIMSRLTPGEAVSTVVAAGWSQWRNSRPHYGTDSGAFGERLGGLAIKQTSQAVLTYGVFAAAFHEDPRYYVMGPSKPLVHRALFSALTVAYTRKDDGSSGINWARFAGNAAATALTTAYYPVQDHGFGNESKAFATSLATTVLNSELHEFGGDVFRWIHLKKP